MSLRLAKAIVRLSAALAASETRSRWREEWLAELDAADQAEARRSEAGRRALPRSLGAPWDALMTRRPRPRAAGEPPRVAWYGWRSDLKQAARLTMRSPWQTITTVLCLGVGLGATATVFSIVNALLWGERPGIRDRASLSQVYVQVQAPGYAPTLNAVSIDQFEQLRRTSTSTIAGVAAEATASLSVRVNGDTTSVTAAFVSGNYFSVLGTSTNAGRLIGPDDDMTLRPVAVVSQAFWRSRLGGDNEAIGRPIVVGERSFTIIGIAPARFTGWEAPDIERGRSGIQLWLPLSLARDWPGLPAPSDLWPTAIVRHADGVWREAVRQSLQPVGSTLQAAASPRMIEHRHDVQLAALGHPPGSAGSPAALFTALAAVLAAPFAVLLIGCANVANLRLARATERTRELAVRLSLGASRWQIARMLIVEIAVATALAMLAGWVGARVMLTQVAGLLPFPVDLDGRVALFAGALAAGAVALSGLAPSWLVAGRLLGAGIRQTPQSGGLGHSRLRNVLVGGQVAFSVVLLIIGALFARSTTRLLDAIPPVANDLIVAELNLESAGHDAASASVFAENLLTRLNQDVRVRAAAIMDARLFGASGYAGWRAESDDADEWRRSASVRRVSEQWFGATDARLIEGRLLTNADRPAAVVVVNETFARGLSPDQSVVGHTTILRVSERLAAQIAGATTPEPPANVLTRPGATPPAVMIPVEIVGVVADSTEHPKNAVRERPESRTYFLLAGDVPLSATLLVRADDPAPLLDQGLQRIIAATDSRTPWVQIESARALFVREFGDTLYFGLSLAGLSVVSLGLAMTGLYAIVAYVVSLRTREIGIRLAMGARPSQVLALVVWNALRLVGGGACVGLVASVPVAFAVQSMLIGISPIDPVAVVSTVMLLALTGVAASLVPARRAARINPIEAIRDE